MRLLLYLSFSIIVAAVDQPEKFHANSSRNEVELNLWVEASSAIWDDTFVCCAISNLSDRPYWFNASTGNDTPPIFFSIVDKSGGKASLTDAACNLGLGMINGNMPRGMLRHRLLPGEAMITKFSVGKDTFFESGNPAQAQITARWNNELDAESSMHALAANISLPSQPKLIPKISSLPKAFSAKELCIREDRIADGLEKPSVVAEPHTLSLHKINADAPPTTGTNVSSTSLQAPRLAQLPTPKKAPESKPTPTTPSEEPPASTPWSIIVVLIVAALGLLWLLLKRRS